MAKYDIPPYPMKRLRYFTNQFLTEKDFIDDQAAHLAREQAHLRALCVAGVLEGLLVASSGTTTALSVAAGVAVDKLGRLIALDDVAAGPAPSGLPTGDHFLYIAYREVESDLSTNTGGAGTANNTRWHSEPVIGAVLKTSALPDNAIVLASFAVAGGAITANSLSTVGRQYSGLRLPGPSPTIAATLTNRNDGTNDGVQLSGALTVTGAVAANGVTAPTLAATTSLSAPSITGAVSFTGAATMQSSLLVQAALTANQSVSLATQSGSVGIGLASPTAKLHVFGNDPANVGVRVENANTTGKARIDIVGAANSLTSSMLKCMSASAAGSQAGAAIVFGDTETSGSAAAIKVRTSSSAADKGTMTLIAGGQGAEAMDGQLTILPNGNVGVGTAAPANRLDVNGAARADSITAGTHALPPVSPPSINHSLFTNSADNELYWRNHNGANVQLTSGGTVNFQQFKGGFAGDYVSVAATATFNDFAKTYMFLDGTAKFANVNVKTIGLVNTNSRGVSLVYPEAGNSSYSVTFPGSAPSATAVIQMDASGTLSASNTLVNDLVLTSGKSVTISGDGKFKHGIRTINIPIQPLTGAVSTTATIAADFTLTQNNALLAPVTGVPVGARIRAVRARVVIASGLTVAFFIKPSTSDPPAWATQGAWSQTSTTVSTSTQIITLTMPTDASGYSVTAFAEMLIKISAASTAGSNKVFHIELDYDQP